MACRAGTWIASAIITMGLATYAQLLTTAHFPTAVPLRARSTFPGLLSTHTQRNSAHPAVQWQPGPRKLRPEFHSRSLQAEPLPSNAETLPLNLDLYQTTRLLTRWNHWLNWLNSRQP